MLIQRIAGSLLVGIIAVTGVPAPQPAVEPAIEVTPKVVASTKLIPLDVLNARRAAAELRASRSQARTPKSTDHSVRKAHKNSKTVVVHRAPAAKKKAKKVKVYKVSSAGNRALGKRLASARGWGSGRQWYCLEKLWTEESGWSTTSDNPNSDAYGIPQALPGSKMGRGWRTNATVQIKWGLKYISGRYGTPCSALSTKHSKGWY